MRDLSKGVKMSSRRPLRSCRHPYRWCLDCALSDAVERSAERVQRRVEALLHERYGPALRALTHQPGDGHGG